jgi:uncharacterized protein YkwD/LysM repeat protein
MHKLTSHITLVLVVLVILIPSQSAWARSAKSLSWQTTANELIAAVNAFRASNGLPAYTVNSALMQIAQDQANYMAATGQVAHRPGLTQRILDAGYPLAGDLSQGGFRAENITGGNKTASQAVQEWSGDSLHLSTMLSLNLTEIGAGVAQVGNTYYLVIDCARPTTNGAPQVYTPDPGSTESETFSSNDFIVPVTTSTPDENGLVYHEVQSGQSLWAIAIAYGVKIDDIRALNNLRPGTDIYQGDRLLVRKYAPSPMATSAIVVGGTTVPTGAGRSIKVTSSPSATLFPTDTQTTLVANVEPNSITGIAIGIVLATLLFAGLLTWISSRRSI